MGIYDVVKDAAKAAQKADNIELYKQLLDVQQMALDMQEKQQRQNNRIQELEDENKQLKAELEEQGNFVLDQAVYWQKDDTARRQPYCPSCMAKRLKVPMSPNRQNTNIAYFHCPNCKFGTDLNGYRPEAVHYG